MKPLPYLLLRLLPIALGLSLSCQNTPKFNCEDSCNLDCIRSGELAGTYSGMASIREVKYQDSQLITDTTFLEKETFHLIHRDSTLYDLEWERGCQYFEVHIICAIGMNFFRPDCSWQLTWDYQVREESRFAYDPSSHSFEVSLKLIDTFGKDVTDNNGNILYHEHQEKYLDMVAIR